MPRHQLLAICDEAQVPCGPVYSIDEIFADPQYRARGNIAIVKDERVGEVALANVVPVLSATPGSIDSLGPPLGAHTGTIGRPVTRSRRQTATKSSDLVRRTL